MKKGLTVFFVLLLVLTSGTVALAKPKSTEPVVTMLTVSYATPGAPCDFQVLAESSNVVGLTLFYRSNGEQGFKDQVRNSV